MHIYGPGSGIRPAYQIGTSADGPGRHVGENQSGSSAGTKVAEKEAEQWDGKELFMSGKRKERVSKFMLELVNKEKRGT